MIVCTHLIGPACDWQIIAFMRSFLALVFAAILAISAGAQLVLLRPRILWLRSLAGSGSMVCTFYALTRMEPADVVTLTNMFPIWIALLSWPLAHETPSKAVWLSIGSGVVGVVLIQQPHIAEGNFAVLAALAASVFTAFAMMGLNRLQGLDSRAIVVHFSGVAAMTCLASYFVFDHKPAPPFAVHAATAWLLLGIGVTATLGQLCLTKAFASSNAPAKVSVINLSQIVFVMVIEWLIAPRRQLDWYSLLGTVCIVAPTAWLLLRNGSRMPKRKTSLIPHAQPVTAQGRGAGARVAATSSPSLSAAAISSLAPAPASSSARSGSGRAAGGLS
jgi:drug/metabolite transporter (DMT)-like permease